MPGGIEEYSKKIHFAWMAQKFSVNSFIHLVVCLTTGPKPLPKPALHTVRSWASSFKWEYPLLSLRSSSSFLNLLPHLPVTSIPPFIFPSITHCRRQFLHKMWPIQLAFRLLISCRIFLCSLTLILHFSCDRSNWSSPSFSSNTFQNFPAVSDLLPEASKFQHHIKLCSKCSILLVSSSILSQVRQFRQYIYSKHASCFNRKISCTLPFGLELVRSELYTCMEHIGKPIIHMQLQLKQDTHLLQWDGLGMCHVWVRRGGVRVLVGKPEGKRRLSRPRRRWVDNNRMDLQEVGCGYMGWIGLA